MRHCILKFFTFVFLIILLDKIVGLACEKLYYKSNDYTIHKLCYTLDSTREDILIFGSSRAEHHFIPTILDREIGLSSYNCGFGGEGLVFSYIQIKETLKRYKPKTIVLEISPNILIDPESQQKLKMLMPFNNKDPFISAALTKDSILEKFKLLSYIYPYNSTIASLITGSFKQKTDTLKGFRPLVGTVDTSGLFNRIKVSFSTSSIPAERLADLKNILSFCSSNNVQTIAVMTPIFETNKNYDDMSKQIELICRQFKNVSFLDFGKDNDFYENRKYFKDNLHLNYQGAELFSEKFSKKLRLSQLYNKL